MFDNNAAGHVGKKAAKKNLQEWSVLTLQNEKAGPTQMAVDATKFWCSEIFAYLREHGGYFSFRLKVETVMRSKPTFAYIPNTPDFRHALLYSSFCSKPMVGAQGKKK